MSVKDGWPGLYYVHDGLRWFRLDEDGDGVETSHLQSLDGIAADVKDAVTTLPSDNLYQDKPQGLVFFFYSRPYFSVPLRWIHFSQQGTWQKSHTHTFSTQGNYLLITKRKVHVYIYAQTHTSSFTRSPWYNCNGWLGVKHQVTYLLTHSQARARRHTQTSRQTHGQKPMHSVPPVQRPPWQKQHWFRTSCHYTPQPL